MNKWFVLLLSLILVIQGFLLVAKVNKASFDSDEIFSVMFSRYSSNDLLKATPYDPGNPPLHFILLKAPLFLFGDNEVGARSLSIFFGFLSLLVFAYIAFKQLDLPLYASSLAVLLFSSSATLFHYNIYARPYALLLFCTLAIFSIFLSLIEGKALSKKEFFWGVVTALIGFHTHYSFSVFLVLLLTGCVPLFIRDRQFLMRSIMLLFLPVLGFLPWVVLFMKNQVHAETAYNFWQLNQSHLTPQKWLPELMNASFSNFAFVSKSTLASFTCISLGFLGLILYGKIKNKKQKFVLLFIFLSYLAVFLTPLGSYLSENRYYIFLIPLTFLTIIIYIKELPRVSRILGSLAVLSIIFLGYQNIYLGNFQEGWRDMGRYLSEQHGHSIIISDYCHFPKITQYYYTGDSSITCLEDWKNSYAFSTTEYEDLFFVQSIPDTTPDFSLIIQDKDAYEISEHSFDNLNVYTFKRKEVME